MVTRGYVPAQRYRPVANVRPAAVRPAAARPAVRRYLIQSPDPIGKREGGCETVSSALIPIIFRVMYFILLGLKIRLIVMAFFLTQPQSLAPLEPLSEPPPVVDLNQIKVTDLKSWSESDGAECEEAFDAAVQMELTILQDGCVNHLNRSLNETNVMRRMRLAVQYNLIDFRALISKWAINHKAQLFEYYADQMPAQAEETVWRIGILNELLLFALMFSSIPCLWPAFYWNLSLRQLRRNNSFERIALIHLLVGIFVFADLVSGSPAVVAVFNRQFARLYQPTANYSRFVGPFSTDLPYTAASRSALSHFES